ncbi:MAG: diacylglycerol kinase family protein [Lacibacter sp.]|jgi:diacylglycerol kinase
MKSFHYALQGLLSAVRSEKNMRIHIAAAMLVIAAGIFFKVSQTEWMILLFCISFVIAMELMNTALEYVCNAAVPQFHPFIRHAKDMAAAAVLVLAVASAITGGIIFIPKIIVLFF